MSADRMPTSRGITRLAHIPDGECRDGRPELVIRGEQPVIAMPVLARSRHEDTVGHACVEVHMMVERRAEAVQKGDAAESRARTARRGDSGAATRGRDQCPLDLVNGRFS